jgi:hypothetical protein
MNWIIDQKLKENESAEIKKAVDDWDQEAAEDYQKRLQLAYGMWSDLLPVARARAPEAMARVGTPKV